MGFGGEVGFGFSYVNVDQFYVYTQARIERFPNKLFISIQSLYLAHCMML
jgi:hypothetical protein